MGKVRIDLTGIVSGSESYYIQTEEGFVVDIATSNPSAAVTNTTDIAFTTGPAPTVDFSNINDGPIPFRFDTPAEITVVYPQSVTAVAGKNVTVIHDGGPTDYLLSSFDYDADTFTFTLQSNLMLGSEPAVATAEQGAAIDSYGFESELTDATISNNDSGSLAYTSTVFIDYTQSISKNTGDIRVYETIGDVLIDTIAISNATVNGNILEVPLNVILVDDEVEHYVLTDAGIVLDNNDFQAPAITDSVTPEYNTTINYSLVTGQLVLNFNKTVKAGTGNIEVRRSSDNSIIHQYDVSDSQIEFDRHLVNITASLAQNVGYYLLIDNTAVLDLIDTPFAGIASNTAYDFVVDEFLNTVGLAFMDSYRPSPFDYSHDVASTTNGNFYVLGGEYSSGLTGNFILSKFNIAREEVWSREIDANNTSDYEFSRMVIDSSENIYVIGVQNNTSNAFIIKFDSGGTVVWDETIEAINLTGLTLALDSSEDIIIAGSGSGGGSNGQDVFLTKFTAAGAMSWETRLDKLGTDVCRGVHLDASNNIYLIVNHNTSEEAIIKCNSSGTFVWGKALLNHTGTINEVTVDSTNNVYAVGSLTSPISAAIITKFDSSGNIVWSQRNEAMTIYRCVDITNDRIFAAGDESNDVAIVEYDTSGNINWMNKIVGPVDSAYRITADYLNNGLIVATSLNTGGGVNGAALIVQDDGNGKHANATYSYEFFTPIESASAVSTQNQTYTNVAHSYSSGVATSSVVPITITVNSEL